MTTALAGDFRIESVTPGTFATAFAPIAPAAARYHAEHGAPALLLGAMRGDQAAGLLIGTSESGGATCIRHLYVVEPFRRRGVGSRLLAEAVAMGAGRSSVEAAVPASSPFAAVAGTMLIRLGFAPSSSTVTVLHTIDAESRAAIAGFVESRGGPMLARLARRGYSVVTFTEAGDDALAGLRRDIGEFFPDALDPFRPGGMAPGLSHLCCRDGTVYGFCALRDAGVGDVVEVGCIAARRGYGRLGGALAAYARSLEALRWQSRFARVLYTFDSHNPEMRRLYRRGTIIMGKCRESETKLYRLAAGTA